LACFLAPMALAVATSALRRAAKSAAEKLKLGFLEAMLWGGSLLLALEHAWHGEVVPWPPFLTAMQSGADIATLLHEIAFVGVPMSAACVAVWASALALPKLVGALARAPSAAEGQRLVASAEAGARS